jgi:hypothetical protein
MAARVFGAQRLVTAVKHGCAESPDIDLRGMAATIPLHGRLGCVPDNLAGKQGIDDER